MSQTADRKQPYLRWHEVLFSIYCSFVFVLLEESRPYAWSTRLRYYYFWHPHAVALRGIDIDLFYLELFLIPAVAFFVGLRLLSRFSFLQVFLRTASGAIALAAFSADPPVSRDFSSACSGVHIRNRNSLLSSVDLREVAIVDFADHCLADPVLRAFHGSGSGSANRLAAGSMAYLFGPWFCLHPSLGKIFPGNQTA